MSGVVHVVTALERGGAQRVVLDIAAGLHDPGRPQLVVTGPRVDGVAGRSTARSAGSLDDEAEGLLGSRLIRLRDLSNASSAFKDAACLLELTRLLDGLVDRLRSPIVVHTHSSKAGVLGRLATRAIRGVACVHTVHGFGFDALGAARRGLLEAAERLSDSCEAVVFVSEADRARAAALGLYRGVDARVIRAGVDAPLFAAVPQSTSAPRAGAVTIANLKPQKDPLFHVDVLAAWRQRDAGARMVLLGDGPLRDDVQARARSLGVSAQLELPGFVDDVRPYLAGAQAFLLASAWEGLPCSVLEALAAGLPCVVRDTGYASDLSWVKGGRLHSLAREASARQFADALVVAAAQGVKPTKLPREFTKKGMLADVAALYDELVGPPRPTTPMRGRRRPAPRRR